MVKKNAGFTLVEAMLAIAILGIIFGIGSSFFVQVNKFVVLNRAKLELQRDSRTILSLINKNLRQASSTTMVIDQVNGQPYYSRIVFTRGDGAIYRFYQTGTNLIMSTTMNGADNTQTLTKSLRYLAFSPPRSDSLTMISVSMTLEKSIYEGRTKALHMASEKVMIMN